MKLPSMLLALPFLTLAFPATAGTPIPSSLVGNEKQLWPQVMDQFYGAYDKQQDCWVSKSGEDSYCMRPNSLHVMPSGASHLLFFTAAGTPVGGADECDACTGNMGLIVMSDDGPALRTVAQSDLYMEAGSLGHAPDAEAITVHRAGASTYVWAIESGWMGQGISVTVADLYGIVGGEVKTIGQLPTAYDDEGNCENGKNTTTGEKCTGIAFAITYESGGAPTDAYRPITLKSSGKLKGKRFTKTFTTRFDATTQTYPRPDGLPEEVSP